MVQAAFLNKAKPQMKQSLCLWPAALRFVTPSYPFRGSLNVTLQKAGLDFCSLTTVLMLWSPHLSDVFHLSAYTESSYVGSPPACEILRAGVLFLTYTHTPNT